VTSFLDPSLQRVKARLRPLARRVGLAKGEPVWWEKRTKPKAASSGVGDAACNVCGWSGAEFAEPFHVEMATCPRCGSIARDRFLLHGFLLRNPKPWGLRVLETSPRMGRDYRRMMRQWFQYTASDFDESNHVADIKVDLMAIDLPDNSVDVLLTPHVLEHIPDTALALKEIRRILTPGGRMYLQVPLLQGVTAAPTEPEFHGDNTPVFWRFGWDLTATLRAAGFETTLLVTDEWCDSLSGVSPRPAEVGDGFAVNDICEHVVVEDLVSVATPELARRFGFLPSHQFATWECIKR
jgi:SAM-dependent methyltransferase